MVSEIEVGEKSLGKTLIHQNTKREEKNSKHLRLAGFLFRRAGKQCVDAGKRYGATRYDYTGRNGAPQNVGAGKLPYCKQRRQNRD